MRGKIGHGSRLMTTEYAGADYGIGILVIAACNPGTLQQASSCAPAI